MAENAPKVKVVTISKNSAKEQVIKAEEVKKFKYFGAVIHNITNNSGKNNDSK